MADDIVTRLRTTDYEYEDAELAFDAADEIERLQRWKAEAIEVLNRWDSLCGRTLEVVRIGDRKSDAMAEFVESQKAEIERLRTAGDALATWAGHADQCIPDDGERCWCGYETASALWAEARRV